MFFLNTFTKKMFLDYEESKRMREWAKEYGHVMNLSYIDLYPKDKYWFDDYYYSIDNVKKIMKLQKYIIKQKNLLEYIIVYGKQLKRTDALSCLHIENIVSNHIKNIQSHVRGYLTRLKIIREFEKLFKMFEEHEEEVKTQTEKYEKYKKLSEKRETMNKIVFMKNMALFLGSIVYSQNNPVNIPSNTKPRDKVKTEFSNPPSARNVPAQVTVHNSDTVGKVAFGLGAGGLIAAKLIKGGLTIALTGGTGGIAIALSFVF